MVGMKLREENERINKFPLLHIVEHCRRLGAKKKIG
jgi:hypothetical protein